MGTMKKTVGSIVLGALLTLGMAQIGAAQGAPPPQIHTCVLFVTGVFRFVTAPGSCLPLLEFAVDWNIAGPQGPAGPTGPQGMPGLPGVISDARHNTFGGAGAFTSNTTGSFNTALGSNALLRNTTGTLNTALGSNALFYNSTNGGSTAVGVNALLENTTGIANTGLGINALRNNTTGSANIAVGPNAGENLGSGSYNIYLGNRGGTQTESSTMRLGDPGLQFATFIAGISRANVSGVPVFINTSTGQLGITASSARYKRDIQAMGERSRDLLKLRPVTFRYTQDVQGERQYGLIAEEVATVYPELVVTGTDGKVETVRYQELIPMLLNEVQHQQQELGAQTRQLAELKAQNAQLQTVVRQMQAREEAQRVQNAALGARLERLETGHAPTLVSR